MWTNSTSCIVFVITSDCPETVQNTPLLHWYIHRATSSFIFAYLKSIIILASLYLSSKQHPWSLFYWQTTVWYFQVLPLISKVDDEAMIFPTSISVYLIKLGSDMLCHSFFRKKKHNTWQWEIRSEKWKRQII